MRPTRMTVTHRVFIDSSILIAAAISARGAARDLLRHGFQGDVDLCISSLVLEESERNLRLKAPEAVTDFGIFRDLLVTRLIDPPESLVRFVAEVVVWKDAPIVAAAVVAGARYLATYDRKHLLSQQPVIESHFEIIIATPDQMLSHRR